MSVNGASITTVTKPPLNPDGACATNPETGACEESEPCKPETQSAVFVVNGTRRHRATMSPTDGSTPVYLHFGAGDPNTLTVDLGARFPNLTSKCGETSMILEIFEKVSGPEGEVLARVALATLGCSPCSTETADPGE